MDLTTACLNQLMHNHSGCGGVTSDIVPPTSPHHHLGSQSPPCQYLSRDNLTLNRDNKQTNEGVPPPSLFDKNVPRTFCATKRVLETSTPTYPGFESLGEGRGIRTRVYE